MKTREHPMAVPHQSPETRLLPRHISLEAQLRKQDKRPSSPAQDVPTEVSAPVFSASPLSGVIVTCPGEGRMALRRTRNTDCALLWGCTPTLLLLTLYCQLDRIFALLS